MGRGGTLCCAVMCCVVLCSKLLVRLRNYKYEETLRYFLLAVDLVSREVLPFVSTTSECKAWKRSTYATNNFVTNNAVFRIITTVRMSSLVFQRPLLKIPVFWGMTLYRPVYRYICFLGACCFHLQGSPKLKTAGGISSETSAPLDKPTGPIVKKTRFFMRSTARASNLVNHFWFCGM